MKIKMAEILQRRHLCTRFRGMKRRCEIPKCVAYKNYGGRGIKCLFKSSDEFVDYVTNDMGITDINQIKRLQIDRIDNDGHYCKGNIRFVTQTENLRNRSPHNRHNQTLKRKELRNKLGFLTS